MFRNWFNSIFPVRIERQNLLLVIKDTRPSDIFLLSVVIAAGSLVITAFVFRPLIASGIYWPFLLFFLPAPIFIVKALISPLRATHIFDKSSDVYSFTTRSILKSSSMEGSVSQIRGAQVERRVNSNPETNETTENYRAVLLLKQGLLFGSSDVQPLREDSTMGAYYDIEAEIASAITNYLALDMAEVVDL